MFSTYDQWKLRSPDDERPEPACVACGHDLCLTRDGWLCQRCEDERNEEDASIESLICEGLDE